MSKFLTAEIMADIKVPAGVQISPDGSRIVVSIGTNAREGDHREAAIWLFTTDDGGGGRQITAGTVNDTEPRWLPDASAVSFLSDRDERGFNQIYLLPLAEGGEARKLTDERGGVISHRWLAENGRRVAYLVKDRRDKDEEKRRDAERDDARVWGEFWPYARLRILDIDTNAASDIDLGERHVSGFCPSPDGTRIAVTTSEFPELDSIGTSCWLHLVDVESGENHRIADLDRMFDAIVWSSDGNAIYAIASAGPVPAVSSNQLWTIAMETGARPRLLTPNLEGCLRSLSRGGNGTLFAVVQVGVDTSIYRFQESTEEFNEYRAFEGDLSELSVSADSKVAATLVSTMYRPFDVATIDLQSESSQDAVTPISDLHTYLDEIEFGPYEVVNWERAGFTLDGIVLWPPGKSAEDGPMPTCVSVHGGPYGRWARGFGYARPFAHWLAAHGFLVFMPNARGGSGHGEAFASAVLDSVGKEDWPDILAGIDLIVENGWADSDRLAIGGWSQGGFMAAWAIGHDPDEGQRFKCAVMGAGVSDWGMMVATSDVPTFEQRLGGGNPYESAGPHDFDKWSPISYVHRATTPTLILHGENDERVPLNQAIFMHRGLRKYGCKTEFVVYPREPHGLQERRHVIDLHERIAAWYREKL